LEERERDLRQVDKWKTLRYTIAKSHEKVSKQYLATPNQTGTKADTARTMIATLESIWRAMDAIDEKEKENESNNNNGKPNP